ncbi:DEAD/DEAH box helicase [Micromonospora sp. NPDC020750]|uniref:DEAD/DEAH box helicase n=1 Tax=unclassified Micromonospora TaxID=2617518 RepID=UPI003798B98E
MTANGIRNEAGGARAMTPSVPIDLDTLEAVSSRLELRTPNKEALDSLIFELAQYYDVEGKSSPFESVIDSATGVGKTYIVVGAIEYLAAVGVRNFAIIAPGATIRDKTVGHFTPGHRKSLLGGMESKPYLVTSNNFNTSATRAILDDDSRAKVYVFTVQSLIAPTTKQGRKTHVFQEGLGAGFYAHLSQLDDLVVFADEHHCYFGPAFSEAIVNLDPFAAIGLTATPDKRTPEDQIIYRYPLAAAIADRWVKTPVIVARRDDRVDSFTKLADGVKLLDYKASAAAAYCAEQSLDPINPVMLVVAQNTAEADEFADILRSEEFDRGRWADAILVVHSNLTGEKKEQALAALDDVEDPRSPVRIIISVGMLKEGWDVKSVYVIASMRASVSKVLTEQTLGRGLRLPFGRYTDVEMLDTLEVVAHEKYDALLRTAGVLNEQFIDKRTRAVLRQNSAGQMVAVSETTEVKPQVILDREETGPPLNNDSHDAAEEAHEQGGVALESLESRHVALDKQAATQQTIIETYAPLEGMPKIIVPVLKMTAVQTKFSLADITDLDAFRKLGRQIAADPETELRRMRVSARIVTGRDGLRRTELVTSSTTDRLKASSSLLPLLDMRKSLVDAILAAPVVPKRANQAHPANRIVDAFLEGIGVNKAEEVLSAYGDRATARLVRQVTVEHRRFLGAPQFEEVVELRALGKPRQSKRKVALDRTGKFSKLLAYDSFSCSLYGVDWFDSEPERAVANIAEDSNDVACWVRLQVGELPILWRSDGREYNADLIVVEEEGDHWVVEIKSDDAADSADVQAKRTAARRWVNHVNASDSIDSPWHYLLVTETDIKQAKGSWRALKALET